MISVHVHEHGRADGENTSEARDDDDGDAEAGRGLHVVARHPVRESAPDENNSAEGLRKQQHQNSGAFVVDNVGRFAKTSTTLLLDEQH